MAETVERRSGIMRAGVHPERGGAMQFPVRAEDVKIVQGESGKGLQVVCSCGAVNWNHLEIQDSLWRCRNCKQVFTDYYPGLVEKFLKLHPPGPAPEPASAKA